MEKYQRVRVLGKGSFGSAILIKRRSDNSLFVVKEVSLLKMSKKERDAARHECRILQKLKHPNIVRYVEQFENEKSLYIVMEYCDGGDLCEKIHQMCGPMKESTIMYYFSQICLAMEYLHSFHMLHRDIKTMNVFLMKNGAVKLGDFGITTILRNTMGMANTVCGTPYYFSPELCRNKPYNNKSDIWALGVLLYECATCGRHPFDGANMHQLMQRIVNAPCAALSSQYSPDFRKVVAWCLQKDPRRRPNIKQLLSLPLVRRSLEQLEENLMLATECRVRLKDIIDFDADPPNTEASNEHGAINKTPHQPTPPVEVKRTNQIINLSPGQAAAMAMAEQIPVKSPLERKPSAQALGRKPRAMVENGNENKKNQMTPREVNPVNILNHLRQAQNGVKGASPPAPPLCAKTPSPCCNSRPSLWEAQARNKPESPIAAAREPLPFHEYQPDIQRIKAIMAKYGQNVNPQATETIHAFMRRKQEEYRKKQKDEIERRKCMNELRQKELHCLLAQHRRLALEVENNMNGKAPREMRSPSALPREVGLSPHNGHVPGRLRPPSPSNNEHRSSPVSRSPVQGARALPSPTRAPAPGFQQVFGCDPRCAPTRGPKYVPIANTPACIVNQHKANVAVNSPLFFNRKLLERKKPVVEKFKAKTPLDEPVKAIRKRYCSNGLPLDRLDQKAREIANRGNQEKGFAKPRGCFEANSGSLKKCKNVVEKGAVSQSGHEAGMMIMGMQVPKLRSGAARHGRPLRPAMLNALQHDGKAVEREIAKVVSSDTPVKGENAVGKVCACVYSVLQPDSATPVINQQNRVASSPALTPRRLASLRPVTQALSSDAIDGDPAHLFQQITPKAQSSDASSMPEKKLLLTPPKQQVCAVTERRPSAQSARDSAASSSRPVQNGKTTLPGYHARKPSAPLPALQDDLLLLEASTVHSNKSRENSVSQAELIEVAHSVKGSTPVQDTPMVKRKNANMSRTNSKPTHSPHESETKEDIEDLKPVFHPTTDARPHYLCWPLSDEGARYARMLNGPDMPADEVELLPLKEAVKDPKERDVVVLGMLETLHTIGSEVFLRPDNATSAGFSEQSVLLKRQQDAGIGQPPVTSNDAPITDTNSECNNLPIQSVAERPSSLPQTSSQSAICESADDSTVACENAQGPTLLPLRSEQDSPTNGKARSLVEGYEDMLRHLRSLLEKRRVAYRKIPKLYKNIEEPFKEPSECKSPRRERFASQASSEDTTCDSIGRASNHPPFLLYTKAGKNDMGSIPTGTDELANPLGNDEDSEDTNDDDDDFEDGVPLFPVRCATRNDTFAQMLKHNVIKLTDVNDKASKIKCVSHSNDAVCEKDLIPQRRCTDG